MESTNALSEKTTIEEYKKQKQNYSKSLKTNIKNLADQNQLEAFSVFEKIRDVIPDQMISSKTSNFIQETLEKPDPFVDASYPPTMENLTPLKRENMNFISWFKLPNFFKDGKFCLFNDFSLRKQVLRDRGYSHITDALNVLSVQPCLVIRLFEYTETNQKGIYSVWLNINGMWKEIIIDDYIPIFSYQEKGKVQFYFLTPNLDKREVWMILLQKALAKAYGGFHRLYNGSSAYILRDLTGAPVGTESIIYIAEKQKITEREIKHMNSLFQKITQWLSKGYILSVIPRKTNKMEQKRNALLKVYNKKYFLGQGIYSGHEYAILSSRVVRNSKGTESKIIQLRNPWINEKWEGDWSKDSDLWTEKLKKELGFDPEANGDSQFWMPIKDFMNYFEHLQICRTVPGYVYNAVKLKYPKKNYLRAVIRFHVASKGKYTVSIDQKDLHFFQDKRFRYNEVRLTLCKLENGEFNLLSHTSSQTLRNTSIRKLIDEGEYYVLVEEKCNLHNIEIENEIKNSGNQELYNSIKNWRNSVFSIYGPKSCGIKIIECEDIHVIHDYLIYEGWKNYAKQRIGNKLTDFKLTFDDGHKGDLAIYLLSIPKMIIYAFKNVNDYGVDINTEIMGISNMEIVGPEGKVGFNQHFKINALQHDVFILRPTETKENNSQNANTSFKMKSIVGTRFHGEKEPSKNQTKVYDFLFFDKPFTTGCMIEKYPQLKIASLYDCFGHAVDLREDNLEIKMKTKSIVEAVRVDEEDEPSELVIEETKAEPSKTGTQNQALLKHEEELKKQNDERKMLMEKKKQLLEQHRQQKMLAEQKNHLLMQQKQQQELLQQKRILEEKQKHQQALNQQKKMLEEQQVLQQKMMVEEEKKRMREQIMEQKKKREELLEQKRQKDLIEQQKRQQKDLLEQHRKQKELLEQKKLMEEEQKKIEVQKRLEEERRFEEQQKIENQRRIEEQQKIENQRRIEEQNRLEQQRRIEEKNNLEQQRRSRNASSRKRSSHSPLPVPKLEVPQMDDARLAHLLALSKEEILQISNEELLRLIKYTGIDAFVNLYQADHEYLERLYAKLGEQSEPQAQNPPPTNNKPARRSHNGRSEAKSSNRTSHRNTHRTEQLNQSHLSPKNFQKDFSMVDKRPKNKYKKKVSRPSFLDKPKQQDATQNQEEYHKIEFEYNTKETNFQLQQQNMIQNNFDSRRNIKHNTNAKNYEIPGFGDSPHQKYSSPQEVQQSSGEIHAINSPKKEVIYNRRFSPSPYATGNNDRHSYNPPAHVYQTQHQARGHSYQQNYAAPYGSNPDFQIVDNDKYISTGYDERGDHQPNLVLEPYQEQMMKNNYREMEYRGYEKESPMNLEILEPFQSNFFHNEPQDTNPGYYRPKRYENRDLDPTAYQVPQGFMQGIRSPESNLRDHHQRVTNEGSFYSRSNNQFSEQDFHHEDRRYGRSRSKRRNQDMGVHRVPYKRDASRDSYQRRRSPLQQQFNDSRDALTSIPVKNNVKDMRRRDDSGSLLKRGFHPGSRRNVANDGRLHLRGSGRRIGGGFGSRDGSRDRRSYNF